MMTERLSLLVITCGECAMTFYTQDPDSAKVRFCPSCAGNTIAASHIMYASVEGGRILP